MKILNTVYSWAFVTIASITSVITVVPLYQSPSVDTKSRERFVVTNASPFTARLSLKDYVNKTTTIDIASQKWYTVNPVGLASMKVELLMPEGNKVVPMPDKVFSNADQVYITGNPITKEYRGVYFRQ